MTYTRFEVARSDLTTHRLHTLGQPELQEGDVRVGIDRFALTANNITYGVVGERIGYWKFFPAADDWGLIPVWGFADVTESRNPNVPVGDRLYGYFPMATEWVLSPRRIHRDRLQDGAAHRAELPPVYNNYARTLNEQFYEPTFDNERALLMPLFATSYCLYDFVRANDYFKSTRVILTSASSKTAIGCACALRDDDACSTLGLTSENQVARVKALGIYDEVLAYPEYEEIDAGVRTTIIDIAGNGEVLSSLHRHLGDNMAYTSNVGLTHYDKNSMGPDFIRERSALFFAPGHMQQRAKDWGPGVFQQRAFEFWMKHAASSREWLTIDIYRGMESIPGVFDAVRNGALPADHGAVVVL